MLQALPDRARRALELAMEPVALAFGEVLYEPGDAIRQVYFPNDSLVSFLTVVDGRSALEVGMVGHEGMVGTPLILDEDASPVRALVQGAGTAQRMDATSFRREFARSPLLRRALYRHLASLMAQVGRTAACNRFHRVEARLGRWLLMTSDRVRATEFRLTHQFLSHMLGVRRTGVTEAATALQERGLIAYHRGMISILRRRGLEEASCSCYRAVAGGSSRSYSRFTTA